MFAPVEIRGQKLHMLVDCGCDKTILALSEYLLIPAHKRPELQPLNEGVKQANQSVLEIVGMAEVEIRVGPVAFVGTILVADIRQQGLLGNDFVQGTRADVRFSSMDLLVHGLSIPCKPADDQYFGVRLM